MLSPAAISSMSDELCKIAALSEEEAAELKKAVRQQAKFDAQSARGGMSEADRAAHRANVDRIKQYREKKQGKREKVDTWARDPHGRPKTGPSPRAAPPPRGTRPGGPPPRGAGPGGRGPTGRYGRSDPFGGADDFNQWWENFKRKHDERRQRWAEEDAARRRARQARQARGAAPPRPHAPPPRNPTPFTPPSPPAGGGGIGHIAVPIGLGLGAAGLGGYLYWKSRQDDKAAREAAAAPPPVAA